MDGHRHLHSPEEIELLIAESRDGGLLEPEEQQRLHRALRLTRRTARDLMVPREKLSALPIDAPWDDVVRIVTATPFSRLPIYRGTLDQVVGMLRVKDLVQRYVTDGPQPLDRLMRPIQHLPETLTADRVIALLRERRAHQAVVVDARRPRRRSDHHSGPARRTARTAGGGGGSGPAMMIAAVLLVCLVLVAANGVFVAAEFALLAAPRPAMEQRAARGEPFARRVLRLLTIAGPPGSLHRDVAARHYHREPRSRHVRRARARDAARAAHRRDRDHQPRRARRDDRDRRPDRGAHRDRRDGPEGPGAPAPGGGGSLHGLADAPHARRAVSAREAVEYCGQAVPAPRRHHATGEHARTALHPRGAAAHRRGERTRRRPPRRGRPDPARTVRVRRSDRQLK